MMSLISTHVLDTVSGRPAEGIDVSLELMDTASDCRAIGHGRTDSDGRISTLIPPGHTLAPGRYTLTFDTKAYHLRNDRSTFHPVVIVVFDVERTAEHYHIPLLLSPFGYTTYRGS